MPYDGGWMDQPAGWLERTNTILNTVEAMRNWKRAKNKATWGTNHPREQAVVMRVWKLRIDRGR